jgi:hypothetical protein
MGITDLFRPKYRHSNVAVRAEAVRALTADDAAILIQVARTDRDAGVRRLALERIDEAEVLAELAAAESERSLRDLAGERAAKLWSAAACSEDADAAGAALAGIVKLGDQHALADVAANARGAAMRKRAFGELRDPRALAELAKGGAPQDLRLAAVARIDDGDALRALAIDTTSKEIGLAAVDKLEDSGRLEQVAQKAKNKAVRQRARKVVQEIAEADAAKKPGVPDDVKRRRAEQAQLVREVETLADSFDFEGVTPKIRAAEAAWRELGAEPDERFTKATERFWKRKQVHDEQARSADELRAVQREAEAQREARSVAPAAEPAEPPQRSSRDDIATSREPAIEDSRKAEREAEKLRRADEQAERERRAKEDVERGAAIAASLGALCEDMERLANDRDTRAIDRLLQQAGKAFEQIGKVPPAERDAIAERYTAARGKLVVRSKDLREGEEWARFQNVPKAEALIDTVKQLLAAPQTPDLGNRLRSLQALWKEVGPMPQRRSKELWDQFKALCDQIYDHVKVQRAADAEKFVEVAKVKEALIADAEALADSSEFAATADKLKALQAEWKASGHLPRKQGDELWKRFRGACDRFFARRKPLLEEQRAQEARNLEAKQALIARAKQIAETAPADGGWGKAIAQIKELQRQWTDIGFVPRRDADAVYRAFRTACDALFAKRDQARDVEADAHRAVRDAAAAELAAVIAAPIGEPDIVSRALAARDRAREAGGLGREVADMLQHVVSAHPSATAGTELDPSRVRAARDKLIARAEELMPKAAASASPAASPAELAAQLKDAMRANAFGDLRFSGRDPVEVVDELRVQWSELAPFAETDDDRARAARFATVCTQVLEHASGHRDERSRDDSRERPRRSRRERRSGEMTPLGKPPASAATQGRIPVEAGAAAASPPPDASSPEPVVTARSIHEEVTVPVVQPIVPQPAPPIVPSEPPARPSEPSRAKSASTLPPLDELDTAWDMPEDDPTATKDDPGGNDGAPPSASEMAGDSATGGDGIDEPGWD